MSQLNGDLSQPWQIEEDANGAAGVLVVAVFIEETQCVPIDVMRFTMFRHLPTGEVCRVADVVDGYFVAGPDEEGFTMHWNPPTFWELHEPYDSERQGWPSELEGL
ncbi:hypothetical protein IAD21_00911 [Abditibacteriota bacterium]|nr:hypothetical protein IAD21_00911 [Abditibacteriota bacterium]